MARVRCKTCSTVNPSGRTTCLQCNAPLPKVTIEVGAAPSPAPQHVQFSKGQVVAGRYTVLDLVGKGGMGCIYKVHDNVLGEIVALKTLLPQFAQDRIVVERFFNEAKITRRLSHPNIVRVHDIGSADGVIYISMEFLDGDSLRAIMEKSGKDGRLPLEYVFGVMDRLCSALEYAHKYTIHRDIKPENVMICKDGTVKLMDFGISKLMASQGLTGNAMVMGTPMYMPPEQLRDSGNVDARADLFSIGVMLYEMLTGHLPTGIPKPASHLYSDIPEILDDIVAQCVAQKPENRYPDAKTLRNTLRDSKSPVKKVAAIPQSRPAEPTKHNGRRIVGLLLAGVVCIGMTIGFFKAEARRTELAVSEPVTTTSPVDTLRSRLASSSLTDEKLSLYEEAERRWSALTDTETNARGREEALQYYLGALLLEEGMHFVPPGEVVTNSGTVYVPAFLIDESEVTVSAFNRFINDSNWRLPDAIKGIATLYPNLPAFGVTWFDALAFATSQDKNLPTSAQWSRAAANESGVLTRFPWGEEWEPEAANLAPRGTPQGPKPVKRFDKDLVEASGCYDLAGNVAEWTRSPESGDNTEPDFGVKMIVRGGSHRTIPKPLLATEAVPCEEKREDLGFRCVRELPVYDAALDAILARVP